MNIDFTFDLFKFEVFHNSTQGIEIRKKQGSFKKSDLRVLRSLAVHDQLEFYNSKLLLKPNFPFLKEIPKTMK